MHLFLCLLFHYSKIFQKRLFHLLEINIIAVQRQHPMQQHTNFSCPSLAEIQNPSLTCLQPLVIIMLLLPFRRQTFLDSTFEQDNADLAFLGLAYFIEHSNFSLIIVATNDWIIFPREAKWSSTICMYITFFICLTVITHSGCAHSVFLFHFFCYSNYVLESELMGKIIKTPF